MKNNIFNFSKIAFIAMIAVFTSCKKPDTTPPVIILEGSASITIFLQGTYTELWAVATDDVNGSLSPVLSGTVNTNLAGVYLLTYSATDAAGNTGSAVRTVTVQNAAAAMAGSYQCTITAGGSPAPPYLQTVTASSTLNNKINFSRFSNYDGNTSIYAMAAGAAITIPRQQASQIGIPPADRTFAGFGNTNPGGFQLTYTDSTSTGSVTKSEVFVKQ